MKYYLCLLVTGGCLIVGFLVPELYWLGAFGFVFLFIFLSEYFKQPKLAFASFLPVFLAYFSVFFFWLTRYQIAMYALSVGLLAILCTFYFVLLGWLWQKCATNIGKILAAGLAWMTLEELFQLTPFGSAVLGMLFRAPPELMQIVSFIGFAGFSALVISTAAAVAIFIRMRTLRSFAWCLFFAVLFTTSCLWSYQQFNMPPAKMKFRAALIQHNLPMDGMWRLNHPDEIKQKYRELALEAAKQKPGLIVFPLYSLPEDPLRRSDFFSALARETNTYILLATHIPRIPGQSVFKEGFFNAALLFSPAGKLIGEYRATQHAPSFGEIREWVEKEYLIINSPLGKLGILLCYEDTKPTAAKKAVRQGAEILIALSNPGHFTGTELPRIHLWQDQLRAIESARPLLRVSANGYSAVINSHGRIEKQTGLSREEIIFT